MSYGEARDFLAKHTKLVELTNEEGARVAVCPEWQGRVMTSTCGGLDGPSFGFVNHEFIEAGKPDRASTTTAAKNAVALARGRASSACGSSRASKQVLGQLVHPAGVQRRRLEGRPAGQRRAAAWPRRMKFQNASATDFDST